MAKTMRKKEFKNSNFGGKFCELLIQCWFPNKFDFRKRELNEVFINIEQREN